VIKVNVVRLVSIN